MPTTKSLKSKLFKKRKRKNLRCFLGKVGVGGSFLFLLLLLLVLVQLCWSYYYYNHTKSSHLTKIINFHVVEQSSRSNDNNRPRRVPIEHGYEQESKRDDGDIVLSARKDMKDDDPQNLHHGLVPSSFSLSSQTKHHHHNNYESPVDPSSAKESTRTPSRRGIDFIITAFPKCATSTQQQVLNMHEEITMLQKTITVEGRKRNVEYALKTERAVRKLANHVSNTRLRLGEYDDGHDDEQKEEEGGTQKTNPDHHYHQQQQQQHRKIGIKWPTAIVGDHIQFLTHLRNHYPTMNDPKIIIGMRHPVLWFQSLYNFKYANNKTVPLLETLTSPDRYYDELKTFFDLARFELSLMQLGMLIDLDSTSGSTTITPTTTGNSTLNNDTTVKHPLPQYQQYHQQQHFPNLTTNNKVFLYVQEQFEDPLELKKMYDDLTTFLDLKTPIQPEWISSSSTTTTTTHPIPRHPTFPLDICHSNYTTLRQIFLRNGNITSMWIREKLLLLMDDEHHSNHHHHNHQDQHDQQQKRYHVRDGIVIGGGTNDFMAHIQSWGTDPCLT